jgi:virulence factor
MSRRVRVALVGAGSMASRYHHPSLASFEDVDLVGICDLVPAKAERTAERFGIERTFSALPEMLEATDPEVVYVLMPPQYLFEPATTVLRQGRHLFIEKPLALTTYQAHVLADLAAKHNALSMVGFQRRHTPAMTDLRARVEARGPIHHATVDFFKSTPHFDRSSGFYDGVIDPLTSDGIHAVDTLRWLCGGEVVDIHASVQRLNVPGPFPNRYLALVSFSSGAVGVLQFTYNTGRRVFRSEFHGRNATAHVDPDNESWIVMDDGQMERKPTRDWGTAGGAMGDSPEHWLGFWHESRHFIDCVKEGRAPTSHFGDAVKTMALAEHIIDAGERAAGQDRAIGTWP